MASNYFYKLLSLLAYHIMEPSAMNNSRTAKPIVDYVKQIFPPVDCEENYVVKKVIGRGSYGYVAKAVRKDNGADVAIKKQINLFKSLP